MLRHKIILTVILVLLLAVAVYVGLRFFQKRSAEGTPKVTVSYTSEAYTFAGGEEQSLPNLSFSENLCVGEDNTGLGLSELTGKSSGALFNIEEKSIPFAHNLYKRVYPASITKLMTAILILQYGHLDEVVTIKKEDLDLEEGSQMAGFAVGDQVTLGNLLYAILIKSGNDAAMAAARHVGGSAELFVREMNDELKAIGATGSHFTNPTGLHDEDHYTTVYDIYLMLNAARQFDTFLDIIRFSSYDIPVTHKDGTAATIRLDSTDSYLTKAVAPPRNVKVLGGKTGTTSAAGHCLALLSQNAFGQLHISVLVGEPTAESLYNDMNMLLAATNS